MGAIKLHCCGCGRWKSYPRDIDPDIPPQVVRIEHNLCDRCDNGEFGTEDWFDAAGRLVSQEEFASARGGKGDRPSEPVRGPAGGPAGDAGGAAREA